MDSEPISAEALEGSIDALEDLFYVFSDDGTFVEWNAKFATVTGYSDDELSDLKPTDIVSEAEREVVEDAIETVLEGAHSSRFSTVLETKTGSHIPYEFRWAPLDSEDRTDKAVVSIGREIDDHESVKRKQEQRQQRYRILAENFPNGGVFLFDEEMRLEIAQGRGLEAAGIDPGDFEGQRVEAVFDDEQPSRFVEMCQAALDGRSQTSKLTFNDRTFRVYTVPVGEATDGAQSGVAMTQDITDQTEVMGQSKRLDQVTNVVSHDLRNPLTVAKAHLELAREASDSEHLDEVEYALTRMETLIEDVLTLSRLGTVLGDRELVALSTMATDCWATVDTADATLTSRADRKIEADKSRLRQVFENLFRNAIQHGADDVTVTVGELDDGFYIEDDGPGISEDARHEVFETGYTTRKKGTGFGLSIVKEIVNAHDWGIRLAADQHGGARFEITGVTFVGD